jgi:hypothetical protein
VDVDVDVVGADGVDAWADGVVDVVGVAELLSVLKTFFSLATLRLWYRKLEYLSLARF